MKRHFVESLECPVCSGSGFSLDVFHEDDREVRSATLSCGSCATRYEIDKGILSIMPLSADEVLTEMESWTGKIDLDEFDADLHNIYRDMMLCLPYLEERHEKDIKSRIQWYLFGQNFEKFGLAGDLEGKLVLDVGAGRCWTSAALAEQGARVVALDILTSLYMGLETADVFLQERPVYFERVQADMHNLPFRDGVFDAIIVNVSAHHAADPQRFFQESRRVLKPDGRLVLVSEPIAWPGDEPAPECEEGIIEQQISASGWFRLFKACGFVSDSCEVADGRGICCVLVKKEARGRLVGSLTTRAHRFSANADVAFWRAVHPLLPAKSYIKRSREWMRDLGPSIRMSIRRLAIGLELPTSPRVFRSGPAYRRSGSFRSLAAPTTLAPCSQEGSLWLGHGWFRTDPRLPGLRRTFKKASARISIPPGSDTIRLALGMPDRMPSAVEVSIAIDGQQMGTIVVGEAGIKSYWFPLKGYEAGSDSSHLELKVQRRDTSALPDRLSDPYVLGIYVGEIQVFAGEPQEMRTAI